MIDPRPGPILAAHVALQFVDRGRLRPANDVDYHGLMRLTAEAANLKISIVCIQRFAESGGRLGRALER
jgi:hypothetical protein